MSNVLKMGGSFARAGLAAAAIAAAALTFATPAAAVDYVYVASATPVNEYGMVQSGNVVGVPFDPSEPGGGRESVFFMSPYVLKGNNGLDAGVGHAFDDVLAFCIDFYIDLTIDNDEFYTTGVNTIATQYEVGSLTEHQTEIFQLVNFGTDLWRTEVRNNALYIKLAAIQGAIWQIQTGKTFQFQPGSGDLDMDWDTDPASNALIQQYANLDFGGHVVSQDTIRVIIDEHSQPLAYSLRTSVPEPATWGMMIGGFFVAGAMVRRTRRASVSAA